MNPTNAPRQKLPGVYTLIEKAWQFYKANFKRLWPLFLLGGLASQSPRIGTSSNSNSKALDFIHVSPSIIVAIVIVLLIVIIFLFLSKIALFKAISDTRKNKFVSIKDSYKKALSLFWPTVLIGIISTLAVSGGFVLLIVPGIILALYLSFKQYELSDQDKRGFKALLGSWALVRNYWWSVFWRTLGTSVILGLITFGVVLAVIIPAIILIIAAVYLKLMWLAIVFVVIGVLCLLVFAGLVMAPLGVLVGFEIYFALREVHASENLADSVTDSKRKNRIIGAMVIGVIGLVAFFVGMSYLIKNVLPKLETSSSLSSRILHPRGDVFTYEDLNDMYTIDYPTSWSIAGESLKNDSGYENEVSFSPNTETYKGSSFATTTIYIKVGGAGNELNTLDKLKETILSSLKDSQYTKFDSIISATTTVGATPAVTISYIQTDILQPSATSTATSTRTAVFIKSFLKGSDFFFFSYAADTSKYLHYLPTVQRMLDSWYLYYAEAKIGDSYQYVNKDYGISLLYPQTWLQAGSQPESGLITEAVAPNFENGFLTPATLISVYVANYPSNLDTYKKLMMTGKFDGSNSLKNYKVSQTTSTKLGGYDAYRVDYSFDGAGSEIASSTGTVFFTVQNKKVYQLSFFRIAPTNPLIEKTQASFKIETPQVVTKENRPFGYSLTTPALWPDDGMEDDFANSVVQGYVLPNISPILYKGSLSISVPDDYYVNSDHTIEQYRNESLGSWQKGTAAVHDFKLLETGTTTINGLPGAYFIGVYPGAYDTTGQVGSQLKAKQYFVSNSGVVRWITYIDDEKDFDSYVADVDQVVATFKVR